MESNVSYLAILGAALSSFLIGGIWYSPILFANAWMRETGLTEDRLRRDMNRVFVGAFALTVVAAANLAFFLGRNAGLGWGMGAGALAGIGWAVTSLAIVFLFERRSRTLIAIDGGYLAVSYTAMGAIIGVIQ